MNNVDLVTIFLNENKICQINKLEVPCEKRFSAVIPAAKSNLVFKDHADNSYTHSLTFEKDWIHLSIRVHSNLGCQIDCVLSDAEKFNESDFTNGEINGIRFQPFFITGGQIENAQMAGKGLFERGFHFSGRITPGNISLSCICDHCCKSFRIKSFHTGFSNVSYFYSESGLQTLVVSSYIEGAPPAIGNADFEKLAILEA